MSAQDTLAQRYGAPAPWRRRTLTGACVLVAVVFLGWLAWTIYEHSTPQVSSELKTFSITDDHEATAVLEVSLANADVHATCILNAYAEDHSTVGQVAFHPDPDQGQRQTVTIKTERRATSVESIGCTAPGQKQPQ